MEKYINKLIRGFKRLFNKKYVAIVSIFVGIITVLGFTYGYLSEESGWQLATQLRVNDLYYTMTIDGDSASFVNVAANSGTTYHDIVITSLNDINTRYSLTYKSSINGVTVAASSSSENKQEGIIGLYTTGTATEKTKTIRVAITNNTANAAIVTFNVAGGYTWNPESQVAILSGYSRITNLFNERLIGYGLTLAEEINTILNCTPTASSPCYYIQNSNNYLTYAGNTWRIVGTYLVNDEYLVKLVLSDHISSKVTYTNVSSALTTFYNGLSDKSLIEGSAMSITKAEYDAIGGVNSYLYTKPDEEYWLGTQYYVGTSRGSSNLTSSATAYVRPAIFLKTDVVNANIGEYGTLINPYEIVQGKQLIFQYMDNASTNLLAGYYVPGQTYTLNNPTNSDSNYTFNKWEVSGTGASLSGTTFTMGTGNSTLKAVWDIQYVYTGTEEIYEVPLTGYYIAETYNTNGGYASGYIYLEEGEKLYVDVSNDTTKSTSIRCYGDGNGSCTTKGSQDENNSRIMYVNPSASVNTWAVATIQTSFVSGMAGMNAPSGTTSSATSTYQTKHPTGKYFLNPKVKYTSGTIGKAKIFYLGPTITKVTNKLNDVRYIKDCTNYNSYNNYHQWRDIQAIKDGVNVAKGKSITSNGAATSGREFTYTVDGQFSNNYSQSSTSGEVCVTIDLGQTYDLDEINVWHVISGRVFTNNKTYVSSDNSTYTVVINEATSETFLGKRVSAYDEIINGYIADGLIVWYDGYANNGSKAERNTSTTTWKNLVYAANATTNNGTITSGSWGDNYLTFNGTSTWVKVAKLNPTYLTLEGVFKSTATTGTAQYVAANVESGGYGLALLNDRQFRSLIYGNSLGEYSYATSTITASTSTIYNASTSFDGTNQKIHVFGEEVATTPLTDTIKSASGNTPLAVGVNPNGTSTDGGWFKGQIYSIRLYNRALTDDEIYHNYLVDKERFGLD